MEIKHFNHPHLHDRGGKISDHHSSKSYYVMAVLGKDKMLWGPYRTQDTAERIGLTRANGNFEVIPLDTSDLGTATQILREKGIVDQGFSGDSFRRFRHH